MLYNEGRKEIYIFLINDNSLKIRTIKSGDRNKRLVVVQRNCLFR